MTLNLIFLTITIRLKEETMEEALHEQRVRKIIEDNHEKIRNLGGMSRYF